MLLTLVLSVVMSLFSQSPAPVQTPLAFPAPTATTAAGCTVEVKAFIDKENAAAGIKPGPITDRSLIPAAQRISTARLAMLKACAARVDPKTVDDKDLTAALQLFADASMLDAAQQVFARAIAMKSAPANRAAFLTMAIPIERRFAPPNTDRTWRVANVYPTMEKHTDELDANTSATFDQKWSVHTYLESVYRGDDIDAGIIKHGQWIISAGDACAPQDRAKLGRSVVSAHVNMAEAYAGQNMNDKALQLLDDARTKWSDAGAAATVEPTLARYKLVGTKAAPITAPTWFNGPASKSLDFAGKVTLLEFSAHWCGPCRESYPGINRLRAKYGSQGFQFALSTRLYGYFESERSVTADAEIAKDKTYFAHHELADVPVAIGPMINIKVVDGKVVYEPQQDPNDVAYHVSGIPQIQLIDKKGVVRLIMIGYDNTNEAKLAKVIESLLNEK